ncbi:hypothetical protein EW026_g1921 [Hermanssonia centrifuga]|uniref:Uncharacterized protein n=1 Tax=Hermanssonia centrifuga TaxID=98765 RepID=A0A4S4KQT7_9APHY|nr:hypothetical protein EW026_g1921 [Hermanssonia centrifuga]
MANNVLRVSVPTTPASLKRKAAAMEQEEEESEKARRAKIMQYMNPRINRSSGPSYRILDLLERVATSKRQVAAVAEAAAAAGLPTMALPGASAHPADPSATALADSTVNIRPQPYTIYINASP